MECNLSWFTNWVSLEKGGCQKKWNWVRRICNDDQKERLGGVNTKEFAPPPGAGVCLAAPATRGGASVASWGPAAPPSACTSCCLLCRALPRGGLKVWVACTQVCRTNYPRKSQHMHKYYVIIGFEQKESSPWGLHCISQLAPPTLLQPQRGQVTRSRAKTQIQISGIFSKYL